jgi:hypothetical protein
MEGLGSMGGGDNNQKDKPDTAEAVVEEKGQFG